MNTKEVYAHFNTPRNLQNHMLNVAGLVRVLKEHWIGPEVDWDMLTKAALLHDIGNVIKFDLDNAPELLGDELPRLEYWRTEQKRLIEQYGADEHAATNEMLGELHVDEAIRETIQTKSFGNAKETAGSNNWQVKILPYCDLRAMPHGIGSLDARIADLKTRSKKYGSRPDFSELAAACRVVEQHIQSALNAPLEEVATQTAVDHYRPKLLAQPIN